MKVKRKILVSIFGEYTFEDIEKLCPQYNVELLIGFKPSMDIYMYLGVKGEKDDIEKLKKNIKDNGNKVFKRSPRTAIEWRFH